MAEKIYCVKENYLVRVDVSQSCNVGYYHHDRPTHENDIILSVVSSMVLAPRETKQDDKPKLCDPQPVRKRIVEKVYDNHNNTTLPVTNCNGKSVQIKRGKPDKVASTDSVTPKLIVPPKSDSNNVLLREYQIS